MRYVKIVGNIWHMAYGYIMWYTFHNFWRLMVGATCGTKEYWNKISGVKEKKYLFTTSSKWADGGVMSLLRKKLLTYNGCAHQRAKAHLSVKTIHGQQAGEMQSKLNRVPHFLAGKQDIGDQEISCRKRTFFQEISWF